MGTNITGIGNANAIGFKSRVTGGTYFPPELKDALVGVWSAYGKSNDSTDRNIIKNKIKDRGGDFVISNAAFKLNSGFGKYETELSNTRIWTQSKETTSSPFSSNYNGLSGWIVFANTELTNSVDMPSFKIQVKGLLEGQELIYRYYDSTGQTNVYSMTKDGKYTLPADVRTAKPLTSNTSGFQIVKNETNTITITQIPSFEGAFVTDGVDDLITSTKTVQEMLEGSNEITIVSMVHQVKDTVNNVSFTNYIRGSANGYFRNIVNNYGKTGIYGYTSSDLRSLSVINNILGDKNDYTSNGDNRDTIINGNFSVQGYSYNNSNNTGDFSSVAWYWTVIANKVLTTDQINQVIAYYNLDRCVEPTVLYDVKRQGLSNDTPDSDWYLKDFSKNGFDMSLFNFAKDGDSGIGKYNYPNWKVTATVAKTYLTIVNYPTVNGTYSINVSGVSEMMQSIGMHLEVKYTTPTGTIYNDIKQDGVYSYILPDGATDLTLRFGGIPGIVNEPCNITITQIPSHAGALCLDGVNDFGKVTGMPIYKDYTVVADYVRTFAKENVRDAPILSKSQVAGSGAFLFNYLNADSITSSYSFGTNNILKEINDSERKIYYLSKYASDGHNVNAGSAVDYDTMWLGTYRDNISNFFTGALYFAMLFPYSLSEFLLERQIKKARAGTLYSNQVEFRPIIPEDENITRIDYFVVDSGIWKVIKPGDYVDVGARIVLNVYTKLPYKIEKVSSLAFTGMSVEPSTKLNIFDVKGYIKDKTPQKIKLTLAVNEDIVQWNPAITSNLLDSFTVSSWYLNGWDNTLTVGTWIKKTDRVFFKATFKTELYGLETATFGGTECVVSKADNWSDSKNIWDIRMLGTVGDLSQVFNLDVYELIRFEDIVQPYPLFFEFTDENGNLISWGGKAKVGSTITRTKGVIYANLLEGLYTITNPRLNGVPLSSSQHVVEKSMVFTCTATWAFDNNEPKCILSPSRLRIPNSSYKILGHIPDISGHGNNGVIHNSAYAGTSGANGYPYDYNNSSFWCDSILAKVVSGELVEYFAVKNSTGFSNITSGVYKGEIKVTGVTKAISENKISRLRIYTNSTTDNELIDITQDGNYNIDIKGVGDANRVFFYAIPNNPNESIVVRLTEPIYIEQVGEYEGAYCLDGVDDFVTIPTTVGGKQVLMKVNWQSDVGAVTLYDQRLNLPDYEFAIYNGTRDLDDNPVIAYQGRNNGQTYIDGILNSNIMASELKAITHNITITNELSLGTNNTYPVIGSTRSNTHFAQMSLYDFMLFDEISIDDKIKELNEYIGLSGNIFEFNPPTFTIDLPMAIKNIKVYQGGNEISPGYLYPNKDTEFEVYVSLNDGKYAVDTITVDGVEITKDRVVGEYNIFKFILNGSSEQKIKIHSYEYIMYEDINQPYPVIFKVKDRTTNQIYSWGDRIKIGSSIQLIHGENPNLLPELYSIISYTYEGNSYSYNQLTNLVITVTKTISVSCQKTWKLGSNEPKCILSPKRLKLANSSYKYLGYIPDISGNGNNGVFNNFAFSGMSGANGYTYEYTNTSDFSVLSKYARTINSEKIEFFGYTNAVTFYRKNPTYKGKIKIEGLTSAISSGKVQHFQIYTNSKTNIETSVFKTDGVYDIDVTGIGDATNVYFYVLPANTSESGTLDNPITIEQVGNYEGAICFDGIDDYMDIPSLSIGGKQVLMKTNWLKSPTLLYDQRASGSFAVLTTKEDDAVNPRIAYQGRNQDGKTYIDGIENNYIETYSLKGITHNITVTNPSAGSGVVPVIGANTGKSSSFAKMALYDFMLFDEVSTNEEIKQLNDIVGIEGGYVQKPPYYWDAYGKTNSDADRDTIQQRGVAIGDYDLINNNFAYEGMSGYNGYPAVFGTNKTYANLVPNDGNFILTSSHNIINVTKFDTSYGLLYSHIKLDGKLTSRNIDYPSYKIKVTGLGENFGLHYSYLESSSDTTVKGFEINNDGIYIIPKSFASDGSLTSNSDWIGFIFTGTAPESCNVTIEVLPEYENGLVYDGVDDYSENTSIPAFTDYTYIIKYEDFNNPNTGSCIQRKGSIKAGRGAFVQDHIYRGTKYQYNFGISSNIHKDDSIAFCTKTNYNGTAIPSGNNTDDTGFTIGKFDGYRKMVFYKEMLYPRTVNMLTINMIKNMMAEDGIIDIQGKLFTDKYTGDFNLDFNKDFLIGN